MNNMNIPFVDLKIQYLEIKRELDDAIFSVMKGGNFILGENVASFEKEFCEYLDGGHAVSVNSGTDALYLSLLACGITSNDEVITVSHTFIATYLAIVQAGAKPVFVDIDPSTFNIDTNQIENKITEKTKAIIPVHLYGHPADMQRINELAKKYNLYVIEDACQAHGARIKDTKVGLWGDLSCFSFYPTKNLGAYGDGGIIVTTNKDFKKKLVSLRNYGQEKKYYHDRFGWNTRLDEIQATVLRVKLRYLDKWNNSRRSIAKQYCEQIASSQVLCPIEKKGFFHVYHLFVIRTSHRSKLQKWLADNGIYTQIHYPVPVHVQKCYQIEFREKFNLPITEKYYHEILSLPMYPEMSQDQIEYIIKIINAFHN